MGKTGIIDVGGGMRGVYSAGVFDRCIDDGVEFDIAIGISAGSANVASFLAGQRGRNLPFFVEYSFRKQYMGIGNLLKKRSYIDLDYVYSTLSDEGGENPLDYEAIVGNAAELVVVGSHALTGETAYFGKDDMAQDDYGILKASSAIPVVCHPYEVRGEPYFDGALGDTAPIERAFQMGCDKVVLVLTKPKDEVRSASKDEKMAKLLRLKYPKAAERLAGRALRYNQGVALAKRLESEGKALIVAPENTMGVDTLTKDKDAMLRLYEAGYEDGARITDFAIRPSGMG